jgi:4-amino-4-deoxy-L-arabinose transferase-like glycosyltransferase
MRLHQCRARQPTSAQLVTAIYLKLQLVLAQQPQVREQEQAQQRLARELEQVQEQQPELAQQQLVQELQQPVRLRAQRQQLRQLQ